MKVLQDKVKKVEERADVASRQTIQESYSTVAKEWRDIQDGLLMRCSHLNDLVDTWEVRSYSTAQKFYFIVSFSTFYSCWSRNVELSVSPWPVWRNLFIGWTWTDDRAAPWKKLDARCRLDSLNYSSKMCCYHFWVDWNVARMSAYDARSATVRSRGVSLLLLNQKS